MFAQYKSLVALTAIVWLVANSPATVAAPGGNGLGLGINVGIGGGNNGVGIGIGIGIGGGNAGGNGNGNGNGGGGGSAGGAPIPLLGATLLGQAGAAGGLYLAWRRRRKKASA